MNSIYVNPISLLQEPGSWNERGFTVAMGDGLFKHVDRSKVVSVDLKR